MTQDTIGVGIIGANPERGWALNAHLPAVTALPDFRLAAVSTTRQETADETARRFGAPHAFADWRELVRHPEVDLVIVGVKVALHRDMTLAALAAGKHVFCEWPLGLTSAEAEEMLEAAKASGRRHMVGLQGRANPYLTYVRDLVQEGWLGEVISCTLVSSLASWGARLPPAEEYRTHRESGATGLTIPGGHSLDALCFCLGEFAELSAIVTTQHRTTEIIGTGRTVPVTAPDQVLVSGRLAGGAVAGIHIKADIQAPAGVRFEINGTTGDLILASRQPVGPSPVGIQRAEMVLTGSRSGPTGYEELPIPDRYSVTPDGLPRTGPPFYTGQLLARLATAIRTGTDSEPDFATALARHRMLDMVQAASDSGARQRL